MTDALAAARQRLNVGMDREPPSKPLDADQWVVNSLLQKSIRRGEVEIAQSAALTFLAQRGSAIWRRFIIIAYEDVGAASPDVVGTTVAVSADANWRKQSGGDAAIALYLAQLLAEAPKCRSAEHLVTTAIRHPHFELERCRAGGRSIADNMTAVADASSSLVPRGVAACCVSGIGSKQGNPSRSDLARLLRTFVSLGVPDELVQVTKIAANRVRDAIILMVPLVWLVANRNETAVAMEDDLPDTLIGDGIPMYALDKHTRVGREAIRGLVMSHGEIRECLNRYVARAQHHDAAYMAAFYADAAPLARKLVWQGGDELEALGTEADLLKVGVPYEGMRPLLSLFRDSVDPC